MGVQELLAKIEALGVALRVNGDRIQFSPPGSLPDNLRSELRSHGLDLLAALRCPPSVSEALPGTVEPDRWPVTEGELLSMPLEDFARSGAVVRVWSSVLEERLILAADNGDVEPGERRVVYRAGELRELAGLSPEGLQEVHRVKKLFRGRIVPA